MRPWPRSDDRNPVASSGVREGRVSSNGGVGFRPGWSPAMVGRGAAAGSDPGPRGPPPAAGGMNGHAGPACPCRPKEHRAGPHATRPTEGFDRATRRSADAPASVGKAFPGMGSPSPGCRPSGSAGPSAIAVGVLRKHGGRPRRCLPGRDPGRPGRGCPGFRAAAPTPGGAAMPSRIGRRVCAPHGPGQARPAFSLLPGCHGACNLRDRSMEECRMTSEADRCPDLGPILARAGLSVSAGPVRVLPGPDTSSRLGEGWRPPESSKVPP